MYAMREQSLRPDLWPAISRKLPANPSVANSSPTALLSRRRALPSRLLFVPIVVALLIVAALLYLQMQAPLEASAMQAFRHAQQLASSDDSAAFDTFHGVTVGEFKNEFGPGVVRVWREEWFQAPGHYCRKIVNTPTRGTEYHESWCTDGIEGYLYNNSFDLVMLREPQSVKFQPFSQVSLDTLRDNLGSDLYDVKVEGTEEILGRVAYVFDMRLKANLPNNIQTDNVHVRAWIDRERFFFLKLIVWNADDVLISTQAYESFEVGGKLPPDVLKYTPPANAYIVDLRTAQDEAALVARWQGLKSKVSFPLKMGPAQLPPSNLDSGLPYYDARKGVVAFSYHYIRNSGVLSMDTVIIQGPVSALPVDGLGTGREVEYAGMKGRFYGQAIDRRNDYGTLVVDSDGVRTIIRKYFTGQSPQRAWLIYRQLESVP
jgi:outer membrane lipoprotein-sorting protein